MGRLQRRGLSLAAAMLAAAFGGNPDLVTMRLLDPQDSPAWPGTPLYRIEVRQTPLAPFPGMERMWSRVRHDRVDTVPGVRTFGPVRVVGENRVIGLYAEEGGGGAPGVFAYDAFSRTLTLSPLPKWLSDAVLNPPPAFAPGGRHVLLFARSPDGTMRVTVRSWPDGAVALVGLPIRPNPQSSKKLWIEWGNAAEFLASVPVVSDTGPIVLLVHGRVSGTQARLDSATRYIDVTLPRVR